MNLVYGQACHITQILVQPSHVSVIPYWVVNFDWFSKNLSIGTELLIRFRVIHMLLCNPRDCGRMAHENHLRKTKKSRKHTFPQITTIVARRGKTHVIFQLEFPVFSCNFLVPQVNTSVFIGWMDLALFCVNNFLANTLASMTNFEVAGETGSLLHQTGWWDCFGDAFFLPQNGYYEIAQETRSRSIPQDNFMVKF